MRSSPSGSDAPRAGMIATAALVVLAFGSQTASSAIADPERLATVVLRVLGYDRDLPADVGETVDVDVVVSTGAPVPKACSALARAFADIAQHFSLASLPIRIRDVEATTQWLAGWQQADRRPDAVVLCTTLPTSMHHWLATAAAAHRVRVVGLRPEDIDDGAGVAVVPEGDSFAVYVNLHTARAQGASFEPRLLSLARVVR